MAGREHPLVVLNLAPNGSCEIRDREATDAALEFGEEAGIDGSAEDIKKCQFKEVRRYRILQGRNTTSATEYTLPTPIIDHSEEEKLTLQ